MLSKVEQVSHIMHKQCENSNWKRVQVIQKIKAFSKIPTSIQQLKKEFWDVKEAEVS